MLVLLAIGQKNIGTILLLPTYLYEAVLFPGISGGEFPPNRKFPPEKKEHYNVALFAAM